MIVRARQVFLLYYLQMSQSIKGSLAELAHNRHTKKKLGKQFAEDELEKALLELSSSRKLFYLDC